MEGLPDKVMPGRKLERREGIGMRMFGGKAFQTKGTVSAKALGHTSRLGTFLKTIKEACEMEGNEPQRERGQESQKGGIGFVG